MACVALMPIISALILVKELCRRNKKDPETEKEPELPVFDLKKKKDKKVEDEN
jgi:hypothetical protein